MSIQYEFKGNDAFTRSSTATSDSGIHLSDGPELDSGSRKRKRVDDTTEELLKDTFVVKPYPPKSNVKSHTLQPLVLLPRAQLPLSALDLHTSSNALTPSRLFETHVRILELEHRMGDQPMLLIARLDDGRTLYAVEREDRGLYVICKLGSWVSLHQLRAVAATSLLDAPSLSAKKLDLGITVQTDINIGTINPTKFSKKKRLAIEAIQSMVKRPTSGPLPDSQTCETPLEERTEITRLDTNTDVSQDALESTKEPELATGPPAAAEIIENIRSQYFDALYLSKASLAYFAKGPLSRARAAFHLDYESSLEMNDLVTFLEGLILNTSILDKKYKDGLPHCISLLDIEDPSDKDTSKTKLKKKRASKKMKPGKNGLYPNEDESVRTWWTSHEDDFEVGVPGRTREDLTKSRLTSLRIRETQLQMILIMEVMALKPLTSVAEEDTMMLPGDSQATAAAKTSKSKRSDNLTTLMDLHVDRLCIWQSLFSESTKAETPDSQVTPAANKHVENITRDFCVDIIAPFFSARLPDLCAVINKKLGGPVTVSPPKRKLAKSASVSGTLSKPGAATKRPVPVKPRKSLTRILSDERERERRSASAQPNRKISLLRSATMPAIPGFKREGSEVSLSSIPSVESQTSSALNKSGFTSSKRFGHREVDFTSLAREETAKLKKQVSIDDELKTAIAALKKPNRELAGKTFAESIESRTMPLSLSRKSKKPVRNPLFQSVQISATPKINRQTNVYEETQSQAKQEPVEFDFIPPSSIQHIPQSSVPSQHKRPNRDGMLATVQATPSRKTSANDTSLSIPPSSVLQGTPLSRNPLQTTIQATPSRKSSSQSQNQHRQSTLKLSRPPTTMAANPTPSSSLHVRRSSASLFTSLSVPESAMKPPSNQVTPMTELSSFEETPVKKKPTTNAVESTIHCHPLPPIAISLPTPKSVSGKENQLLDTIQVQPVLKTPEESIYKSLGWDADELDELA